MVIITWQHKHSDGSKVTWRLVVKDMPSVSCQPEKKTMDATGEVAWIAVASFSRVQEMMSLALCKLHKSGIPAQDEAASRLGGWLVIDLGLVGGGA
jgi:hypothetical protein